MRRTGLFACLLIACCALPAATGAAPRERGTDDPSYCLYKTAEQPVQRPHPFQRDLEKATDIAGWTWVNRRWDGEKVIPDHIESPDGQSTTTLPALYRAPCTYVQKWLGECQPAGSIFSPATGMAFIQGYEIRFFGKPAPRSYAAYADQIIPLPVSARRAARYSGDVAPLGYAALRGVKEELILYRKDHTVSLGVPGAQPRPQGAPAWRLASDIYGGRAFLQLFTPPEDTQSARPIYEVVQTDGTGTPALRSLSIDPEITGWAAPFSLQDTRQLWLITQSGIYMETAAGFRRVLHLPEGLEIMGRGEIGYTNDKQLYLPLLDVQGVRQPFLLAREKTGADCDLRIDPAQDRLFSIPTAP